MYEQFVGHHLIEAGYITADQLNNIIEAKKTSRIKLGFLAVNEGYITSEKAGKINELQKKEDMRFGDIAVKYGFLTQKQLESLLSKQGISHILFKQNIVDMGYMTLPQLDRAIETFKDDSGYTPDEFEAIQSDDITRISDAFLYVNEFDPKYDDFKALLDFKNLISLTLRNLIRFVSSEIRIERPVKMDTYKGKYLIAQGITGEIPYFLACGSSDSPQALLQLASGFGKEDFKEMDEDSMDSIGEFLNCVNGLYASSQEAEHLNLEMTPQEYHFDATIQQDSMYQLPVYINGNRMDLILSFGRNINII